MGVTTAELGKMLEGGKVMADDFLPKFAAELEKTFPPGEKAMSGLTAETMRLKTAMYELKTTVMDNGGDSMFSGAIRGMRSLTEEAALFVKTLGKADSRILGAMMPGVMYATSVASGARDDNRPLPPATKFDKNLIGGIDLGTSARTDSLFTPQFSSRMRGADEYTDDFGSSLNRNPEYVAPKKHGSKPHPKDLLLEQILSYQKDMERMGVTLGAETGALESGGNFAAAAFDANAPLTTSRYDVTNPMATRYLGGRAGYSLMDTTSRSVQQDADPQQGYGLALEARAFSDAQNSRNAASLEAERGFIAQRDSLGGDSSALDMFRLEQEQQALEQSWAMNTDSFEEHERRKGMIAEVFAEKRKRLEQQTTVQNIQQYGLYASNVSTLANNLYQLSGKRSKELFYISKAVSIGQTTINTAEAVMKAYAQTGIFGGPVAAALVGAVGASQIALIAAQQPDGGGTINSSNAGSFTMPAGGSPVTQPVSSTTQQQPSVTFAPVFHGPVDQQSLTKWFEDYAVPTLRDLKTRGVTA
jgi:hypothetical protein